MLKNDFFEVANWTINNEDEIRKADAEIEKLQYSQNDQYKEVQDDVNETKSEKKSESKTNLSSDAIGLFRNMDDEEAVLEKPKTSLVKRVFKWGGIIILVFCFLLVLILLI